MADLKECAKYAHCDWRKSVGYCPEECNHFKHKDEVIVVRCKDCKHWCPDDDEGHCENPDGLDNYAKADDFCSYGERKDDA